MINLKVTEYIEESFQIEPINKYYIDVNPQDSLSEQKAYAIEFETNDSKHLGASGHKVILTEAGIDFVELKIYYLETGSNYPISISVSPFKNATSESWVNELLKNLVVGIKTTKQQITKEDFEEFYKKTLSQLPKRI